MLSEAWIRVDANFGCERTAKLPTATQKQDRARLRFIHQVLNLARKALKVNGGLLEFVAWDVHAIEVLVNVLKRALCQIKDCLDVQHPQLEVVSIHQVCHVAHE